MSYLHLSTVISNKCRLNITKLSLVIFNNISHILVIFRVKCSKWIVVYKYCKWGLTFRRHNVFIHGKMPNDWEYINKM